MSTTLNTEKLECITNDVTAPIAPPKRGRGRPAKYTKEEREEKYKEATKNWQKEHSAERCQHVKDYQDRARFSYQILCEIWESRDDIIEFKSDKYKNIIQRLVEHKEVLRI